MKFRPLHNIVVVEKLEKDKITAGGIHLVRQHQSRPLIGKVLAVGPGVYLEDKKKFVKTGVEVGDIIAYILSHEKTFKIEGEEVHCVKAEGILGVIRDS